MFAKLRKGSCYCIYADTRFLFTQCKVFLAADLSRWKRSLLFSRITDTRKKPFEYHRESHLSATTRSKPSLMMLPRSMSLPFMIVILVLIIMFLCMMGYFHVWFACNKRYRKKYLAKNPPLSHEEILMQTLKTSTDPKLFQMQTEPEKKQIDAMTKQNIV